MMPPESVATLYDSHALALYRFLLSLTGSEADARDLAGEADPSQRGVFQRNVFGWRPLLPIARACLRQIVSALETHYLEHQRYPSTIEALRSSLPTRTLTDIDGQPFRYSTNEAGSHFTLGSVGQNGLVDAAGNKKKDDLIFSTAPGPTAEKQVIEPGRLF